MKIIPKAAIPLSDRPPIVQQPLALLATKKARRKAGQFRGNV
jgi:hypothetical protein